MRRKRLTSVDCFRLGLVLALTVGTLSGNVSAQPVQASDIPRMLESGGVERRQAIWLVYQMREHDQLRNAVKYLFESNDFEDHKAILNVLRAYGKGLESSLPDWADILDRYMSEEAPEEVLLECIKLAGDWQEHRMMHALGRLAGHPRFRVRQAAVQIMASMGDDNLLPVLLRMAVDERPVYRLYALEGLARFSDSRLTTFMTKAEVDPSKSVRIYAVTTLAEQQNVDEFLCTQPLAKEQDVEVRERILELIGNKGWRRQNYLLHQHLRDSSKILRRAALRSIDRLNDVVAAPLVSRQLEEEKDPELKALGVDVLLSLGTGGGGTGLSRLLLDEPDEKLRLRAALAAEFLKEKGTIGALSRALETDSSPQVRAEAAAALGEIRDPRSAGVLLSALTSPREQYEVRSAAVLALAEMASLENLPSLAGALDKLTDESLRQQLRAIVLRLRSRR
ncbi:MAG: HEAT repeat domain-containing protein [Spirochaetia bacterium]|nr:HEAT repeat domain-containing protein [Spirochaetia bacterium]